MIVQHAPAPAPPDDTRSRIVAAAFQLFYEQGYHATGVATILREAGVHSGSLYHYFDGKDDLLLAVLDHALEILGPFVMQPLERAQHDPLERVFALLAWYRARIESSHGKLGCPIGKLALEVGDDSAAVRKRIDANFASWAAHVERWFVEAGARLPSDVDRGALSRLVLTLMEGGLMQAQTARSLAAFDEAVLHLRRHIEALEQRATTRRSRRKTQRKTVR